LDGWKMPMTGIIPFKIWEFFEFGEPKTNKKKS
jgi:hypothetical protein